MTAVKERRHRAILELLGSDHVHTQQELARALAERGLAATQATVSRDIQELGLVRTSAGYRSASSLRDHVLSVSVVEFLLVVKTPPGAAHLVARGLDETAVDGVAGTVAGDDTLIVVLADRGQAATLKRMLVGG